MGELLYLYLEENNLLDEITERLVVQRNVQLISRQTSDKDAYFEGTKYYDKPDFRKHIDCYKYLYAVNTRFIIDGKVVFSYLTNRSGISTEDEKPNDVYGNEFTNMDYFNAAGKEVVIYNKVKSEIGSEYKKKYVGFSGKSRKKAFRLPTTLRCLLSTEEDFATIICDMYNIDLHNYHSELLNRKIILDKIKSIDEQIRCLENLKKDYLNQICYGEKTNTK